jgi:hypothetical protein
MEDLIGAILGGGGKQEGQEEGQPTGDPLADLLGGILGGAGGAGSTSGGQPDVIGGLLEGILGGGGAPQSGGQPGLGLDDILGILGGGGQQQTAAGPLSPIIDGLAENLGLDPRLAQMVVGFVINKLLSGFAARTAGGAPAAPSGMAPSAPAGAQGGLDLDHLLEGMVSGQLDTRFINKSGLTQELVEQTGMDEELAAASLQETFSLLGAQMPTGGAEEPAPKPKGLEDLLDTW